MSQPVSTSTASRSPLRRSLKGVVLGAVLGIAALASVPVIAGGGHGHEGHHRGGHAMMGGPGGFMGSPQHIDRMVERLLSQVDATEQQRSQIRQIAQAAATDLQGEREAGRRLREQSMALFTQSDVDAAAAESLRQQSIARMDANSRRMTQALVDIARVLTPAQRAKIGEQMAERQRRFEQRMQERGQLRRPDGTPPAAPRQ